MGSADVSETVRVRAADGAAVALGLLAADTWASATPASAATPATPGATADPATPDEWVSREATSAAADGLVDQVVAAERLIGWVRAQQFRALAGLTRLAVWPAWAQASRRTGFGGDWGGNPAMVLAEVELSAALPWSRYEAGHRLTDALDAVGLPQVLHLLEAGAFNETQARAVRTAIGDHLSREKGETPAQLAARKAKVEAAVLAGGVAQAGTVPDPAQDSAEGSAAAGEATAAGETETGTSGDEGGPSVVAETRTAAQLRRSVLKAVLQADPEAAERRRVKAAENREVRMWARKDGMASIEALLSAESAAKVDQALNLMADAARDADRRATERAAAAAAVEAGGAAGDDNAAAFTEPEPDTAATAGTDPAADPRTAQKQAAANRFAQQRTHQQRRADAMTGIFSAILDGRPLPMYPAQSQPGQPARAQPAQPARSQPGQSQPGQSQPGQPAAAQPAAARPSPARPSPAQPSHAQPTQPAAGSADESGAATEDQPRDGTSPSNVAGHDDIDQPADHGTAAEFTDRDDTSETADRDGPNESAGLVDTGDPDYQVDTDEAEDADEGRLIDEHEMTDWTPADTDTPPGPFRDPFADLPATGTSTSNVPGSTGSTVSTVVTGPTLVPAWWEPPHLPTQQRRRAHLVITISYDTLLGRDNLPADLAGYGAITAQAARDLAKHAGTADLLILGQPPQPTAARQTSGRSLPIPKPDRKFGEPPQAGYRPRNDLLRQVILQHQTCRAPSCSRAAEQCDADHLIPDADGGQTEFWNLIPLCRRHHLLKTHGGWNVRWATPDEGTPGTLHWTSPIGRTHLVPPNERPGTTTRPANMSQPDGTGQTGSANQLDSQGSDPPASGSQLSGAAFHDETDDSGHEPGFDAA